MKQTSEMINTVEKIRLTAFVICFVIVVTMQQNMEKQMSFNSSIQNAFFGNISNPLVDEFNLLRYPICEWFETSLYTGYNLNYLKLDLNPDVMPITFLQIQASYIMKNKETLVWGNKGDFSDKGPIGQYKYPYLLNYTPYSVWQDINYSNYNITKLPINEDLSLGLIQNGYLNSQIQSLSASAGYYSSNLQMIGLFRINFQFSASGKTYGQLKFDSFRLSFYGSDDTVRIVFEIFFILLYLNYVYMEGYKIYYKIQQALLLDDEEQRQIEEKQKKHKNLDGDSHRNEEVQPLKSKTFSAQEQADKALKAAMDLKRRAEIVFHTVRKHIQDIWSALDVLILVLITFSISVYGNAVLNPSYERSDPKIPNLTKILQTSKKYSDIFKETNTLNQDFSTQADSLNLYRTIIAVTMLIMWFKLLKYIILTFKKLVEYLDIIINSLEYMIFYLVLLISILMSFALFMHQLYGSSVYEFSSIYNSLVYILGYMMGNNDKLQNLYSYDIGFAFVFSIIFYVIVIIILLNMFFVFVKSVYNDYQENLEKQESQKSSSQRHNEIVKYLHPYWQVYNLVEQIILRFWFTFTIQQDKYEQYMGAKEQKEKMYQREFQENQNSVDFNVDFVNLINMTLESTDNQKFLVEEEKERLLNKQKMDLVNLIWKTILLLLILSLNFILVQEFYDPTNAFQQSDSIERKISLQQAQNQEYQQYQQLSTKNDLLGWLQYGLVDIFEPNLLGQREIQKLRNEEQTEYVLDEANQELQFYKKEYAFLHLHRGYFINSFNVLVNNNIRITIRKPNIYNNSNEIFKNIFPQMKKFFPSTPTQEAGSSNENTTTFNSSAFSMVGRLTIPYTQGYNEQGGYVFYIEPAQTQGLISTLQAYQFLDNMATAVIEFVTFNPIYQRSLAYTIIQFTVNEFGSLETKDIKVTNIKKNSLQTPAEVAILILCVSLSIALFYYMRVTIKTILHKNFSYNRWHSTFILLSLNKSQLFIRERHMPEFLRKGLYLVDISQFLNFLFLAMMGAQISLILLHFLNVNTLCATSSIFDQPIGDLLETYLFSLGTIQDENSYFNAASNIGYLMDIIGVLASLAILTVCLEVIYLVSHNRDFQMLTNSIKYTLSHLLFILLVLFCFIIAFTWMGHLLLGTQYRNFDTFFGSLVEFTDYIFSIPNLAVYRKNDRALEFFMMILPYILTVRFIIVNIFFAVTLRGYLLTKKKADAENNETKINISLTAKEFVLLSIDMLKFREQLPKVGSDQYIMQIIKQFEALKVYSSMKENIRNVTNLTAMKAWAEECAREIKAEHELRKPLAVACNEILQAYIDMNNRGEFDILVKLDKDPKRKVIEYSLKLIYLDYFRTSTNQLDKFNTYFMASKQRMAKILGNDEKAQDYETLRYICLLEANLEENLQSMNFIRNELLALGFDIDADGNVDDRKKIEESKVKKSNIRGKQTFNNPFNNKDPDTFR